MPTLDGKLTEENCPDCFSRGIVSRLIDIKQEWDMEEEGGKLIELYQCKCGYKSKFIDELPLIDEPTPEEIRALRGEKVEGYKLAESFKWVVDYFKTPIRT